MAGSLRFLRGLAAAGGEVSGALAHLIWQKTTRKGRLDQSLRRLAAAGLIRTPGEGRLDDRIVRITAAGRQMAGGAIDPPALWARSWDGLWRIVAFDIPESATALRTRLRRRLHQYRFGWLQNSVWISPDPIAEFRLTLSEQRAVPDSLMFLEARPAGGESHEALVLSAWDFEALAKRHTHYLDILRLRPGRVRSLAAWLDWLETEQRAWLHLIKQDPFLPEPLLPRTYRGREVWAARQAAFADFPNAASAKGGAAS